jgi:tetratricopeptide (TPR) repeat protein
VTRLRLVLPSLLGLALLVGGGVEADAKRLPSKPRPSPQPMPPPPPPAWNQGEEWSNGGVVGGVVPEGPEAGGAHTPAPKQQQLVEATATVWAQAGSRSWTGCSAIANEAGKQLWSSGEEVNNFGEGHHWAGQARECPNAPEVLTMAARSELLRRFDLPEGLDASTDLSTIETGVTQSRARALAWIDAAESELARRRDSRSLGLDYWRARALLSTGDLEGARRSLVKALRESTVEGWKVRRLLALTELYRGNLDAAQVLAKRALLDAPASDQLLSFYVLGVVLDRSGDPAGARRRMQAALDRDDGSQLRALGSALPLHERLYVSAFATTVRNEASGALRLWEAYLARPEPEDPERRLAERHQTALRPLPSNLGGPAHPGEGEHANQSGHQGG